MCGIAGFVTSVPKGVDCLKRMGDTLSHRGPDDSGEFLSPDGRAGLAFRRLSIIDLSPAGHQPMSSGDDTVWLVFNGEIYNFKELREELVRCGHRFRSRADSEVILRAYQEWGIGCIDRLAGMFAFAIWDATNQTMVLARDRIGIKPLFYYVGPGEVVFASEMKAIKRWAGFDDKVDDTAFYDFFTYLYVPSPKTIYERVRKLPPGHYATVVGGELRVHKYWDLDPSRQIAISREDATDELRRILRKVVRRHLASDVPLGAFLSGGVDSTTVTALAQEASTTRLKSFAMGFDVPGHSELDYGREAARSIGTKHYEETLNHADFEALEDTVIGLYDEPFADSSAMPTYCLSRFAKSQVTVVLSGDGGDEVFGGYGSYTNWVQHTRIGGARRDIRRWLWRRLGGMYPTGLRGFRRIEARGLTGLEYFAYLMGGMSELQKRAILAKRFRRQFDGYDALWNFRQHWRDDLDPVTRLQYLDLKTYLPDDILTKVDRATMAWGLEARVPLVDHELIEFVFSLPVHIRLPDGRPKGLLKDAVGAVVPKDILVRAKKGFSVPGTKWLPVQSYRKRVAPTGDVALAGGAFRSRAPWLCGSKLWQVRVAAAFEAEFAKGR